MAGLPASFAKNMFPGQAYGGQPQMYAGQRMSQPSASMPTSAPDTFGFGGDYSSYADLFNPASGNLGPSFSTTPGKQARRQTKLNYRIENLLGRADDYAQGAGRGADTALSQALMGVIDPQSSKVAAARANLASQKLANQIALENQRMGATLGASGRQAASPFAMSQLNLQGALADALQRQSVFDAERQFSGSLLDQLMGRDIQRGATMGSLTWPGIQARSEFDKAAPILGGLIQGGAAVAGAL